MDNEFQMQQKREQERNLNESIQFLVGEIKTMSEALKKIKKEVHTVRAELRNLNKLRPLRTEEEEEAKPQTEQSESESTGEEEAST